MSPLQRQFTTRVSRRGRCCSPSFEPSRSPHDATAGARARFLCWVLAVLASNTCLPAGDDSRSFPDYSELYRDQFTRMLACGPLALSAVCDALQVPLSDDQRRTYVSAAEASGADLLTLKTMGEQHGLSAVGAAASFRDLGRMRLPGILLRDRTVFVAIVGYERERLLIKGPLEEPRLFTEEEFTRRCGLLPVCLLLSRTEITAETLGLSGRARKPPGPQLRASQSMISLGRVIRPGWSGKVELVNGGTQSLKLRAKVSCSCVHAEIGNLVLEPGVSTVLTVTGLQESPGVISHEVSLLNDDDAILLTVPIRGWLAPPVYFEEPVIVIDPLRISQVVSRNIRLIVPSGIHPESLSVDVPDSPAVSARLILPRSADANPETLLRVTVRGDANNVGWVRERVRVRSLGDGPDSISADLVVAAHTAPALQIQPPGLWVREREFSGGWQRRVTVRCDQAMDAPVELRWSDDRCDAIVDTTVVQVSTMELHIVLAGKAPISTGLQGTRPRLISRSAGGTQIEIPVQFGFPALPEADAGTAIRPRASQEK